MSLARCGRVVPLLLRGTKTRVVSHRYMSGFSAYFETLQKPLHHYRNEYNVFKHPGWRLENRLRSIMSFFLYSWIFWHLYFEYAHWWGSEFDESRLDYSKFTDEELGIPPDEEDTVYPANYIPAAELKDQ